MKLGSRSAAVMFCGLVLAQTACLGLGLWVESQFAHAIVEQSLRVESPDADRAIPSSGSLSGPLKLFAFAWIAALQAFVAYLFLSRARSANSQKEHITANELLRRQNDLVRTRDAVVFGLAKLAESRDPDTGDHLERIALYSTMLAKALRRHPRYGREVTASFAKHIGISSALHDIGKVGICDSVLLKQGRLTKEERRCMEKHPEIGARCIRGIEMRLGGSNFLEMARQIAMAHHERWDGTGYPRGLSAESIPLAARIVAVADVYDALTSRRIYKDAYSHEDTVAMIQEGSGSHFDPDMVEVFLRIESQFREISRHNTDCTQFETVDSDERPEDDPEDRSVTSMPLVDMNPTTPYMPTPSVD